MTKKANRFENWLTAKDAAQLLSEKSGHPVRPSYCRQLAKSKRHPVRIQSLGYHQLYHRDDILAAVIKKKHPTE